MTLPARPHLLLLSAVVSLGGCAIGDPTFVPAPMRPESCFAGQIDEAAVEARLAASQDCCTRFDELPVTVVLGPSEAGRTASAATSPPRLESPFIAHPHFSGPTFTFPQGKSRFVLIRISEANPKPTKVSIVLVGTGFTTRAKTCAEGTDIATRYFVPMVTFLDPAKLPIGAAVAGEPSMVEAEPALRFSIPPAAEYLVVHTDPKKLNQLVSLRGGTEFQVFPAGRLFVPMPVDRSANGITTSTGALIFHFGVERGVL